MDGGWLQWVLGAGVSVLCAWNGLLHTRMSEVDKAAQEAIGKVDRSLDESIARLVRDLGEATKQGDRDLWSELNLHKRDYEAFRGQILSNMVTKDDLRGLEDRLIAALHRKQEGP